MGTKKREDITRNYKYKEGTLAERAALGAKQSAKVCGGGSPGGRVGSINFISLLLGTSSSPGLISFDVVIYRVQGTIPVLPGGQIVG